MERKKISFFYPLYVTDARAGERKRNKVQSVTSHTNVYMRYRYTIHRYIHHIYTYRTIHCGGIGNLEKATLGALLHILESRESAGEFSVSLQL